MLKEYIQIKKDGQDTWEIIIKDTSEAKYTEAFARNVSSDDLNEYVNEAIDIIIKEKSDRHEIVDKEYEERKKKIMEIPF
jgi:hypothetical protein